MIVIAYTKEFFFFSKIHQAFYLLIMDFKIEVAINIFLIMIHQYADTV
jgi:hypothetical protein